MKAGKLTPFIQAKVFESQKNEQNSAHVWDKDSVAEVTKQIESGKEVKKHPFFESTDATWRGANINYRMSPEEFSEYVRCANDVNHFSDLYAYSMTDRGIEKITLRDYQRDILGKFQRNRNVIFLASRQIGKCVSPDTEVYVIKNGIVKSMLIGELYYTVKGGFFKWIKILLYRILRTTR
jgi:hypothetical protein